MVSSTHRLHFTPGKGPVPIVQEAGWAPGSVWTGEKSRPHRDSVLDRPARSSVVIPTELPGPHKYKTYFPKKSYTVDNSSNLSTKVIQEICSTCKFFDQFRITGYVLS